MNEEIIFNTLADRLLLLNYPYLFKARTGIFDKYPISIVKNWLSNDPDKRSELLAYNLSAPSLSNPEFSELTMYILKEYEENDKVYRNFMNGNYNLVMTYPKKIYEDVTKWHELTDKYKNSRYRRIRQWAEEKRRDIDHICKEHLNMLESDKRKMQY